MANKNKLVVGAVLNYEKFNTNQFFNEISLHLGGNIVDILCDLIQDSCSVSVTEVQAHEPTLDDCVERVRDGLCEVGMVAEFTELEIKNELIIFTTNFLTYLKQFLEKQKCNLLLTDVTQCYIFGVGTVITLFSKSPTEIMFL